MKRAPCIFEFLPWISTPRPSFTICASLPSSAA